MCEGIPKTWHILYTEPSVLVRMEVPILVFLLLFSYFPIVLPLDIMFYALLFCLFIYALILLVYEKGVIFSSLYNVFNWLLTISQNLQYHLVVNLKELKKCDIIINTKKYTIKLLYHDLFTYVFFHTDTDRDITLDLLQLLPWWQRWCLLLKGTDVFQTFLVILTEWIPVSYWFMSIQCPIQCWGGIGALPFGPLVLLNWRRSGCLRRGGQGQTSL